MNKQCFKCKETKPVSEFYKHNRMADGHLNKCSTCTKRDVAENTELLKNSPHWVAKERERCRIKEAKYRAQGRQQQHHLSKKLWDQRNKHKRRAHRIAGRAVKNGQLQVKTHCESCGVETRLFKHHPDYALPTLVVWLCSKCHGVVHRKPFGAPLPL